MPPSLLALALGGLGRDALKAGVGLAVAVLLVLAFAVSSLAGVLGLAPPGQTPSGDTLAEIPPDQLAVMRQAAAESCGLPWPVLAAIAKVESDFGRNMATSTAGAIGYGQFLPSTWALPGIGDGGDPYDYRDALPAMARYLCASGAAADLPGAIWAYNHAEWYVDRVLAIADQYGAPDPTAPMPGAPGAQVVALARAQLGVPYVWGGASPAPGFDCSGLVQWVYGQIGVGLPRTAQAQFDATVRLSPDELEPGDLVFFSYTYPSAEPITHVGIYLGSGMMINAPDIGDVVREMPVFDGYWGVHYAGAGRVRR